jgi:hypothetical protein
VLARWRQKKKVSVKQEKAAQVIFGSTDFPPPNKLPEKNITGFKALCTPFRFMVFYWVYF